jgi:hypothetical protein
VAHCSKCGQLLPDKRDADWLLNLLTNGENRQVYRGRDGGWWLTRGYGEVPAAAVRELLRRRLIVSVYSDCPEDAYHVGKTIDRKATIEARKVRGNRGVTIYVEPTDTGSVT